MDIELGAACDDIIADRLVETHCKTSVNIEIKISGSLVHLTGGLDGPHLTEFAFDSSHRRIGLLDFSRNRMSICGNNRCRCLNFSSFDN